MKRRTRFGFFGFLTIDYRAAQTYLDKMASEGWALARVWLGVAARFRRTDRTDLHYYVDIAQPVAEDTPEYRAHCRETGWERLYTVRYMNIYRSLPGAETKPIHGEDRETYRRYQSNAVRWMVTCVLAVALLLAVGLAYVSSVGRDFGEAVVTLASVSLALALLLLAAPLVTAGGIAYVGCSLRRVLQWRNAGENETVPAAPWARLRGSLTVLTYLGAGLLTACAAADLAVFAWPLPLMLLGIGTAAGFLITPCAEQERMRQPKRVWMQRCLGVACAVLVIALVRWRAEPGFEDRRAKAAMALPALTPARYAALESSATALLTRAEGQGALEEDGLGEIRTAYYSCRGETGARLILWALRQPGMTGGRESGVWRLESGEELLWLSRRGSEVRLASAPAGAPGVLREQLEDWIGEE